LPDVCDHDDHELYADQWQDEAEDDDDGFAYVGFDCEEQVCEPNSNKARGIDVSQSGGASSSDDIRSSITVTGDLEAEPKRQRTQGGSCGGAAESEVTPEVGTKVVDQGALADYNAARALGDATGTQA